mgnify:CR=1 FL=1
MYTAKQHNLLRDLAKEMNGRHLEETVTIDNHTYTVRTVTPGEDDWVLSRTDASGGDPIKLAVLQSKPKVAAALSAIDGRSVKELFTPPDDMPENIRAAMTEKDWAEWRRDQVLDFIQDNMLPGVIGGLWNAVMTLEDRRDTAQGKVKEKIQEDPHGGSEAMS